MIKEQIQTRNSLADLANLSNSHLSIQLSVDGFSYCVFDNDLIDVVLLKHIDFSERATHENSLLTLVKQVYLEEPFLHEKFQSVKISHNNALGTLVPYEWYNNENHVDYLKYTVPLLPDDQIAVDSVPSVKSNFVYLPFHQINNYLNEIYGEVESVHATTVVLSSLMKYFKDTEKGYFFINVSKKNMDIVYIKNGKLIFHNTFSYFTKEDFIYYILFTMEQLGLEPNEQPITLLGDIDHESPLYGIAYKYVRHVNFLNINNFSLSDDFYEQNPHIKKHQFFQLLNQF
jgi:hypothetical protein